MQVLFLGTGGYHPSDRRHTACVMLPEQGIVFDAGTSFYRVPDHLETPTLDVFLSHAHLDHVVGLTFILVPILTGKLERVTIHGQPEHLDAVRQHLFAPALFPVLPSAFEWRPLSPVVHLPGGVRVTHTPLVHPGRSVGYRLATPDVDLAYITDTTATADAPYAGFVRDVDLLIHECNFPDAQAEWAVKTGHSHLTPVLDLAEQANCGQLVIVHLDPERSDDDPLDLSGRPPRRMPVTIAEDNLSLHLRSRVPKESLTLGRV